jgi:hypothetical protein
MCREGANALACFIEECWSEPIENQCGVLLRAPDLLDFTRTLCRICGTDSLKTMSFITDDGFNAGSEPASMLELAYCNLNSELWSPASAADLIQLMLDQSPRDILNKHNFFGLTPILSVTRNVELKLLVPIVDRLLSAGANPREIDNEGCGILHHLIRQLSACNDFDMPHDKADTFIDLISRLIAHHGCDPLLRDDAGDTPFYEALAPMSWIIWCRALSRAGRHIQADLDQQDLAHHITHSPAYLWAKYDRVKKSLLKDRGEFFYEDGPADGVACSYCKKNIGWHLRREPFDCYGSYLVSVNGEYAQHGSGANHYDGSYCKNIRDPGTCPARIHKGRPRKIYVERSAEELSWRFHVAFRLWREGILTTPKQADIDISGFIAA